MRLSVDWLDAGYKIPPQKNGLGGPDICLEIEGKKVWIEAVAPTTGDESNLNKVPLPRTHSIPLQDNKAISIYEWDGDDVNSSIKLRYLSAISDKYKKIQEYRAKEIIKEDEAAIIAVNAANIRSEFRDNDPLMIRLCYGLGEPGVEVVYTPLTGMEDKGESYNHESFVLKKTNEALKKLTLLFFFVIATLI